MMVSLRKNVFLKHSAHAFTIDLHASLNGRTAVRMLRNGP